MSAVVVGPVARTLLPRFAVVSLWLVPLLVIGQFAMVAIIPVALALFAVLRRARSRAVTAWVIVLGIVYSTPLAIWVLREDGARSLSRDIHPAFVVVIAVVAAAALIAHHQAARTRR